MFSNKRRLTSYSRVPRPRGCGLVDFNRSEFYQPSMIDDFLFVKDNPPYSDGESITITSDVTMLFNQERLDRMTKEALIQHFDSMSVQSPKFADIRSKISDDQLCSIVKSRYIQSPSELMAYSSYLVNAVGEELASIAPHADPAGDPVPTGDPASSPAE